LWNGRSGGYEKCLERLSTKKSGPVPRAAAAPYGADPNDPIHPYDRTSKLLDPSPPQQPRMRRGSPSCLYGTVVPTTGSVTCDAIDGVR
jgi:hypothetical protein